MTKPNPLRQDNALIPDDQERFFREIEIEFMIHELKDPISIIETGLRSLLERREKIGPLTARQEKTLKRTLRSSQKARQMLNGMLEIGRSEAGCFLLCGFSPATIVYKALLDSLETVPGPHVDLLPQGGETEAVRKILRGWGIAVDISPEAKTAEIYQDEIKFRQILGNLFKNALHHRQEKIHIRMQMDAEDNTVVIEVADDGPGIKSKHSQMVFERYTRVTDKSGFSRRGHGLGLAGARIMARCLGGEVAIINGTENGATFQVRIPVTVTGCGQDGVME